MGWGEGKETPAQTELRLLRALARDVRSFLERGTTGNIEAMKETLLKYEQRPRNDTVADPFGHG